MLRLPLVSNKTHEFTDLNHTVSSQNISAIWIIISTSTQSFAKMNANRTKHRNFLDYKRQGHSIIQLSITSIDNVYFHGNYYVYTSKGLLSPFVLNLELRIVTKVSSDSNYKNFGSQHNIFSLIIERKTQ